MIQSKFCGLYIKFIYKENNEDAIKLFEQVEIIFKNKDINHPDLTSTYENMGCTFQSKGELDKALEFQEKSREITIKN